MDSGCQQANRDFLKEGAVKGERNSRLFAAASGKGPVATRTESAHPRHED
jgi:hypothetical protein